MSVTLEIPDDLLARFHSDRSRAEGELLLELAIALYRAGKLPPQLAAELAGVEPRLFESTLIRRQIPMPYSMEDLEHDSHYGGGRR